MSGCDTVQEAVTLQRIVSNRLFEYRFPLCKFMSNSLEFLDFLDFSRVERLKKDRILGTDFIQVLGFVWVPKQDVFQVALAL